MRLDLREQLFKVIDVFLLWGWLSRLELDISAYHMMQLLLAGLWLRLRSFNFMT